MRGQMPCWSPEKTMKPHEETWVTEPTGTTYGPTLTLYVLGEDGMKRPFIGDERMRLAGQAPAMARLLLELKSKIESGAVYVSEGALLNQAIDAVLRAGWVIP